MSTNADVLDYDDSVVDEHDALQLYLIEHR